MREQNPIRRKVKVRWSTEEWTPVIKVASGRESNGHLNRAEAMLDRFTFAKRKPRRKKVAAELWLRAGGRVGVRSTWR